MFKLTAYYKRFKAKRNVLRKLADERSLTRRELAELNRLKKKCENWVRKKQAKHKLRKPRITKEFRRKNIRRGELIDKKCKNGPLSMDEKAELDALQKWVGDWLDKRLPYESYIHPELL